MIWSFNCAGIASIRSCSPGCPQTCVSSSHLRELLEQGFEVAVVKDATAAAILPEGDGYLAALTNFRFIANAVWTTSQAVDRFAGKA